MTESDAPRAAYIHVPFCAHRCGYCDFTLVARRDDLVEPYLAALERDLATLAAPREVETIFFGGGTPTHLSERQLECLLALVLRWFRPVADCEFSVEANPAGLDDGKIAVLAGAGVNRVSLGVQSFDAGVLETLERDHRGREALDVVERLRRRIDNVSLDLIFGVPGQTLDLWRETVRRAVALGPRHVSTYGLTFEKGTSFWSRRNRGALQQAPDELEREMYATAMDELPNAGFAQYELSNFARPGFACRHNETYWRQAPYFGHGPGAARYLNGVREMNHRSVTTWIRRVQAGESPIAEVDALSLEDRAREAAVLGLRRIRGIDRAEFRAHTGFDLEALAGEAIAKNVRSGLLEADALAVRLTREGRFLADAVAVDFV
jgi:oxygen-independent coproporphyrinogen III oxidase